MKPLPLLAAAMLATAVSAHAAIAPEEERLQVIFRDYLEEYFHQQPATATSLGEHRFDGELEDVTPEARQRWDQLSRRTLEKLEREVPEGRLSVDARVDRAIFENELRFQLFTSAELKPFENDARTYGTYLNDSVYALMAQSTAPKEDNIRNAIARMRQAPRITAAARRALRRPVAAILETAIRQNLGAIAFYEKDIFTYAGETPQLEALREAAAAMVVHLREHQVFLEGPCRAAANPEWRLGHALFSRKFELETGTGRTADENLADAQAEFARVSDELYVVARQLWPQVFPGRPFPPDDRAGRRLVVSEVIAAVGKEHPAPNEVIGAVRASVAEIQDFIRKHDYLRLPEPDRCQVIEMPEFRRGNSLAYMDNSPPLDVDGPSFYAVSPPPSDWTEEQQRSFLEEYNSHMLKILTLHEAFPGHYVQLEYSNRHPSLIRRVLRSGSYIEGWAVYGEVAMLNEGYGGGDLKLRLMQLKFYLRAVANSILDHRMHCSGMSDEEAMRFLQEDAFQSVGEAKLKVIRAKQSSVQLSTYFVGRMAHYRLRQAVQREMGDFFNLGRYHQAVLEAGSVPPRHLPELVALRLGVRIPEAK